MSILDDYDELIDNTEYNVLLNKLKDISLEQTPAYAQAWYDILYEYNNDDKVNLLKALNLYETSILKYSIRNSRYSIEKEAEIILTNNEPSYLYITIQNNLASRKFKIKQWSNSVLAAILCDRVGNYFDAYINNIFGEYNKTEYDTNFQTLSDYLKQGIFRDNYYIKITNNSIVDKIESDYQIYYDTIKSILTYNI
jgi:hypothetical protein